MAYAQALRYPDVEVQAVLGNIGIRVPHLLALEARKVLVALLETAVGHRARVEDALPRLDGHGLPEAQRPDGRLGKRDAEKDVHVAAEHIPVDARHEPARGVDDEGIGALSGSGTARGSAAPSVSVGAEESSGIGAAAPANAPGVAASGRPRPGQCCGRGQRQRQCQRQRPRQRPR